MSDQGVNGIEIEMRRLMLTWSPERKCAKATCAVSGRLRPATKAWWKVSSCLAWAAESGLNTKMTPCASLPRIITLTEY